MNLHLTHDDKVLDLFIETATSLGISEDKYLIYTSLSELHYVKSKKALFAPYDSPLFWAQIGDIQQYDKIFLHYLSHELVDFVNKIQTSATIIWVFWGADAFHELPFFREYFFQPETRKLYRKQTHLTPFLSFNPLKIARYFAFYYHDWHNLKQRLKAFERIDYFAHYILQDFALIKAHYPQLKATFVPFHYAAIETVAGTEIKMQGEHILLGNSADFSGNHIDAMLKMRKWNLGTRKLIASLGYGDDNSRKIVLKKGKQWFGAAFEPLTKFMPLEAYNHILTTIGVAMMPQERSQAAANLMVLVWNGAKLYMAEKSTLYQLFSEYGLHVYTIESPHFAEKEAFCPLTERQKTENRQALLRLWGREKYVKMFKNVLNL